MRVAVAGQHRENQSGDKILSCRLAHHYADHFGDAGKADLLVFVIWKNGEDLRKVLDVDTALRASVEAA